MDHLPSALLRHTPDLSDDIVGDEEKEKLTESRPSHRAPRTRLPRCSWF
jgi:hypothetical protein